MDWYATGDINCCIIFMWKWNKSVYEVQIQWFQFFSHSAFFYRQCTCISRTNKCDTIKEYRYLTTYLAPTMIEFPSVNNKLKWSGDVKLPSNVCTSTLLKPEKTRRKGYLEKLQRRCCGQWLVGKEDFFQQELTSQDPASADSSSVMIWSCKSNRLYMYLIIELKCLQKMRWCFRSRIHEVYFKQGLVIFTLSAMGIWCRGLGAQLILQLERNYIKCNQLFPIKFNIKSFGSHTCIVTWVVFS
jgi:hypothetical protein